MNRVVMIKATTEMRIKNGKHNESLLEDREYGKRALKWEKQDTKKSVHKKVEKGWKIVIQGLKRLSSLNDISDREMEVCPIFAEM